MVERLSEESRPLGPDTGHGQPLSRFSAEDARDGSEAVEQCSRAVALALSRRESA